MAELDPSLPLVIDARDPLALTEVVGISLVARTVRLAARAGFREVVVLGDLGRVAAALARRSPPAGITVRVEEREPAPGEQLFDGRTVAAAGLEPIMTLAQAADAGEAERRLFASVRKSVAKDGVVAYYVARPLTRPITRALLRTNMSPNHVTMAAMLCGITAGALAAVGGVTGAAIAGVVLWIGQAIDCIDGDVARLRVEGSKLGEWLDSLADDVSTLAVLLGLGLGIGVSPWPLLGVLGFAAGGLSMAKIYSDLHRLGSTIDSAQYPWFFGKPSEAGRPEGGLSAIFSGLTYLFRRDAYVTLLALLLLVGARVPAFLVLFVGTTSFAVLLVVHLIVKKPSH